MTARIGDNGYDVRDYFALQPEFGTTEDFSLLTAKMP